MDVLTNHSDRGKFAEQYAQDYLLRQGLTLVEKNFFCRLGEIDLIMWHQDTLVFIEVRLRKHTQYGSSLASITRAKQQKIIRTAQYYLVAKDFWERCKCRFDVVGIQASADRWTVDWLMDAFAVQ